MGITRRAAITVGASGLAGTLFGAVPALGQKDSPKKRGAAVAVPTTAAHVALLCNSANPIDRYFVTSREDAQTHRLSTATTSIGVATSFYVKQIADSHEYQIKDHSDGKFWYAPSGGGQFSPNGIMTDGDDANDPNTKFRFVYLGPNQVGGLPHYAIKTRKGYYISFVPDKPDTEAVLTTSVALGPTERVTVVPLLGIQF